MTMIRKESAGDYQIGIWSVRRDGRAWLAQATGPGTLGDGSPHHYPTLAAAYFAFTGERLRAARRAVGDRSCCRRCGLEIEWNGRAWWDRGSATKCGPYMERGEVIQEDHTKLHRPSAGG